MAGKWRPVTVSLPACPAQVYMTHGKYLHLHCHTSMSEKTVFVKTCDLALSSLVPGPTHSMGVYMVLETQSSRDCRLICLTYMSSNWIKLSPTVLFGVLVCRSNRSMVPEILAAIQTSQCQYERQSPTSIPCGVWESVDSDESVKGCISHANFEKAWSNRNSTYSCT